MQSIMEAGHDINPST